MSFNRWFSRILYDRLLLGLPIELLCYTIFFGGVIFVATSETLTATDPHLFFSFGANLWFGYITIIAGVILVLSTHIDGWLMAIRSGRAAMLRGFVGPIVFALIYVAGAFTGKWVGLRFFQDFFASIFAGPPEQTGMLVGTVLFAGVCLFIFVVLWFARRAFDSNQSQSPTVVQRAIERTRR